MKNLVLSDVHNFDTGIKNGRLIAVNTLNEYTYLATKTEVTEYSTNEKQVFFV